MKWKCGLFGYNYNNRSIYTVRSRMDKIDNFNKISKVKMILDFNSL